MGAAPPAPLVEELIALTRVGGLAAGLRRIVDSGLPVPCSAGGHTLLPAGSAGTVAAWHVAGVEVPSDQADVRVLTHSLADTEGLELVKVTARPTAGRVTSGSSLVGALLVAVRLGLTACVLDLAVRHLKTRQVEDQPLAHKQLPQNTIADAATTAELCRYAVLTAAAPIAVEVLHTRLSAIGWQLTILFGASGYLRSHPVRCLYVAELVRDAWVTPATTGRSAPAW